VTSPSGGSGAVSEAVARAEAQLNAFWSASNEDAPKARASTMNFVAVGALGEIPRLREEAEGLAETRAGRVFLMALDAHLAPWEVGSDVSAVCHKEGDTVVCYDRVEITFGAVAVARAGSVLSALSLPEVPTIVEAGRGAPVSLLDPLVLGADRILVDSAEMGVARAAEIARKTAAPLADRAFVRTFTFRELTARFFDDAPAAARAVRHVTVERTSGGKHDPAALFLGWLASRLGWKFTGKASAEDARGDRVGIEILADDPRADLGPGELVSVRLKGELDGAPLELSFARLPEDARAVRWWRRGARNDAHDLRIGFRDESWVLLKCIDATEGDAVYRQAVLAAADWSAR
jgi:Glucose-6-phosphate dehydrogenase subunit